MSLKKDGIIVILSSPSGAGKTTLVKKIAQENNFKISISHTTRKPRSNEKNGEDYYFVSEGEFTNLIKKEEFGSEISDSEAEKILTVGDAVKFIESKAN